jgi:hypothetical protein
MDGTLMGDVFNQCPRCSDDLPWGTTSCHCGWKKRKAAGDKRSPRDPVQCAHEDCQSDATIRVKTRTGWANFCRAHYVAYHTLEAAQATAHIGGTQEKRAYIFAQLRRLAARAASRDWMATINQNGVDILITVGNRRMLDELLERGVIEDDGRLIPPEQRGPRPVLSAPGAEAA